MVSIGIFELVVVLKVLFVIDSPTDGRPCDELECCGPCVVFVVLRPVFELHNRFKAVRTCGEWSLLNQWGRFEWTLIRNYLRLTTDDEENQHALQSVYEIGHVPNVGWSTNGPGYDIGNPCYAHHND